MDGGGEKGAAEGGGKGRGERTLTEVPALRPSGAPPDVVVLGGGIIGLACAWELARQGARVEVVERHRRGGEASVAAAGMLTPLAEVPSGGPLFEACRASRNLWASFRQAIEEESGIGVDYDASGALLAALSEEEEAELVRFEEAARSLGEPVEAASLGWVQRQVPDLSPEARRCLLLPGEHRLDNIKALAALGLAAESRGVTLTRGKEVQRVEVWPTGVRLRGADWSREAGTLVLAAGAWSGSIPGLPPLPVRPVRGQMLLLGGIGWEWNGIVRGPHLYTVRRGTSGLLVGATVEESGFECHPTVEGLARLLAFTRKLLPGLDRQRVETTWAGLRPGTPDGGPILGRLDSPSVVFACGHYRNGILLAPWTARLVASLVLDGDTPAEARPFAPGRFASPG